MIGLVSIVCLQAADVICCTCISAGDFRLKGITFRAVLVDEATQVIIYISLIHSFTVIVVGTRARMSCATRVGRATVGTRWRSSTTRSCCYV
jgi:hypothetical protein